MDERGFCAVIVSLILNKLDIVALGPRPLRPDRRWTEPNSGDY